MPDSLDIEEEGVALITCPICSQQYDDEHKKPKFLPCSHTICVTCLEKSVRSPCNRNKLLSSV